MQISGVPYKFTYVWGANAASPQYITTPIPATSGSPAASQQLGFPPATANPTGTPPNINDYNGVLNYFSLWAQWVQGGSAVPWDSTFSTNNSGYPQNARLASLLYPGVIWISLIDNNMTDPETGGANWSQYPVHGQAVFQTTSTWVCPVGITRVYAELWGGGGGSLGGTGASGAGGGYVADWVPVVPGTTYTVTCGTGGAATGVSPGVSGTSSIFQGLTAGGGIGGGSGPGPGGSGTGFGTSLIIVGQAGTDLTDLGNYSLGAVGNAPGGNAPRGGMGGTINDSGSGGIAPTAPGGGGGANGANNVYCQAGANGWVKLWW